MQFITNITQKGQVTLPKKMRNRLNFSEYDRVIVKIQNNHISIERAENLFSLAGAFKPKNKKSLLKAREKMSKRYKRF